MLPWRDSGRAQEPQKQMPTSPLARRVGPFVHHFLDGNTKRISQAVQGSPPRGIQSKAFKSWVPTNPSASLRAAAERCFPWDASIAGEAGPAKRGIDALKTTSGTCLRSVS